jgi:hypothetical protein
MQRYATSKVMTQLRQTLGNGRRSDNGPYCDSEIAALS